MIRSLLKKLVTWAQESPNGAPAAPTTAPTRFRGADRPIRAGQRAFVRKGPQHLSKTPRCSQPGCGRAMVARELCGQHDIELHPEKHPPCKFVMGHGMTHHYCGKPSSSRGFCKEHYYIEYKKALAAAEKQA